MSLLHSPKIVTNGLVLCLDAADRKSYPGNGTVWKDRSGNENNATLINGPTYSSENGGCLNFSTNKRIDCGTSFQSVITGSNPFSIECWVYPNSSQPSYADIWGNHTEPYKGIVLQQNQTSLNVFSWAFGTGSTWVGSTTFALNTLQNNHLVCVRTSSNYTITYLNNIEVTNNLIVGNLAPNTDFNFQIGTGYNLGSSRYFNGRISNFKIYNKALTPQEVSQNFNVARGRFGI